MIVLYFKHDELKKAAHTVNFQKYTEREHISCVGGVYKTLTGMEVQGIDLNGKVTLSQEKHLVVKLRRFGNNGRALTKDGAKLLLRSEVLGDLEAEKKLIELGYSMNTGVKGRRKMDFIHTRSGFMINRDIVRVWLPGVNWVSVDGYVGNRGVSGESLLFKPSNGRKIPFVELGLFFEAIREVSGGDYNVVVGEILEKFYDYLTR